MKKHDARAKLLIQVYNLENQFLVPGHLIKSKMHSEKGVF